MTFSDVIERFGHDIKQDQLDFAYRRAGSLFEGQIDTMLYWLADRLLLLKCYDNKMVKSPG